jgi:CheY-like chemotaxis protein
MTTRNWNAIASTQSRAFAARREVTETPNDVIGRSHFMLQSRARALRVLVVDDDRDTVDSLAMLLRLWGHDVRSAYGGVLALQLVREARPDVLLLDIAMPNVGGIEVALQLRRHRRFDATRIVAVSGYVDEAHQLLCCQAGIDDFLNKPLEMATLHDLLRFECDRLRPILELPPTEPSIVEILGHCVTIDTVFHADTCRHKEFSAAGPILCGVATAN